MKILKTKSSEKLDEYALPYVKKLEADWFVYNYKEGCYDGNGFAVWKKGDKYYYSDLGHCSCYGPTSDLSSIPYNFSEIKKIAVNYNDYSVEVIEYIKKKCLTSK